MPNEKKIIYVDNAATTSVSEAALQAMLPYYTRAWGNPSAVYSIGRTAKKGLEEARERVARCLNASPAEIFFTAGGTEADNWAIRGAALAMAKQGKDHIITSRFEHHAVLHTCRALEQEGFSVTYLDVHENGIVSPEELEAAITPRTGLVTILYANNEIGTVQPMEELGAVCRRRGVWFHTDAVQAAGVLPIDAGRQPFDLLSVSGHKFHGPKGIGVLYVRQGVAPEIFLYGGAQERGRRAGTENVAGAVGLSIALEDACTNMEERNARVRALRDRLAEGLLQIPRTHLNGDREHRLPGNLNLSFEGIEGESLLLMLDLKGICASSGSACTSGSLDPSHVLLALGLPHELAHGSLRLSLSGENTEEEIDTILQVLPPIVERLRAMSPLWDALQNGRTPY